jgi:hypothetical protein
MCVQLLLFDVAPHYLTSVALCINHAFRQFAGSCTAGKSLGQVRANAASAVAALDQALSILSTVSACAHLLTTVSFMLCRWVTHRQAFWCRDVHVQCLLGQHNASALPLHHTDVPAAFRYTMCFMRLSVTTSTTRQHSKRQQSMQCRYVCNTGAHLVILMLQRCEVQTKQAVPQHRSGTGVALPPWIALYAAHLSMSCCGYLPDTITVGFHPCRLLSMPQQPAPWP